MMLHENVNPYYQCGWCKIAGGCCVLMGQFMTPVFVVERNISTVDGGELAIVIFVDIMGVNTYVIVRYDSHMHFISM